MKLLTILAVFIFFVSCDKNIKHEDSPTPNPEIPQNPLISPDSVLLHMSSSLDFENEPLLKSNENSLYALRVKQGSGNDDIVAYGTFDDLSKAVIKLSKRHVYTIDLAYVPNGKNLIHKHEDGHYGVPFDAVWNKNGELNEVVYCATSSEPVWGLSYGATQEKGISDYMVQSNDWSTVTRYQGVAMCVPNVSADVSLKLYYQMIGFRIKISDFKDGKVTIKGRFGHSYSVTPDNEGNGLIDIVVCPSTMPTSRLFYTYNSASTSGELVELTSEELYAKIMESYNSSEGVKIIYSTTSGEDVLLYENNSFTVKPNTRYTLSFSLSDAIANGGITAEVEETQEMNEEEFEL